MIQLVFDSALKLSWIIGFIRGRVLATKGWNASIADAWRCPRGLDRACFGLRLNTCEGSSTRGS